MLPVAAFRTDALAPHTRYDAWHNLISAVFEPLLPDGRARADITAEASSVNLGQVLLVHAKAEAQHFRRTRRLIAKEGLDHYLIQVYRRGVCQGTYGDIQNVVRPGDVKIIDLAQPFATFNTDFDNTTLTIPRAALAPLLRRSFTASLTRPASISMMATRAPDSRVRAMAKLVAMEVTPTPAFPGAKTRSFPGARSRGVRRAEIRLKASFTVSGKSGSARKSRAPACMALRTSARSLLPE